MMESPWIARAVAWWLVAACAACGSLEPTSSKPPSPDAPDARVCAPPAELCGERCVDLLTDADHCGRCGRVCETGICRYGTCTCPSGFIDDGTRCAPAVPDRAHCGGDLSCPPGARCANGACHCPNAWEIACGSSCVDLRSDDANCGQCGRFCTGATSCQGGRCVCGREGMTACGSRCVDLQTDAEHCGDCFNGCGAGQRCQAGACTCFVTGTTVCDAACVDTNTSTEHCGACFNRCSSGQECDAGRCTCPSAREVVCDGSCSDLQTDPRHCGACGRACPDGMPCAAGRCVARPIEPFSGARVAQSLVTFRWNVAGARVQVCADRACARVVRTLTSSNREARLTEALEPGAYFWRLQTQDGATSSRVSWPFRVDARRGARPGMLPPDFDLDGDGLADVVAVTERSSRVAVFFGARGALSATPDAAFPCPESSCATPALGGDARSVGLQGLRLRNLTDTAEWPSGRSGTPIWLRTPTGARAVFDVNNDGWSDYVGTWVSTTSLRVWFGTDSSARSSWSSESGTSLRTLTAPAAVAGVGDVNGDGFTDVLVGSAPRAWVYYGSSAGLDRSSVVPVAPRSDGFGESVSAAGDLNGDGYADLLVRVRRAGAAVYLGGPSVTLHRWIASPTSDDLVVSRAGDVNGDGYGDLIAVPVASGAGWLYLGGATGLSESPVVLRDGPWTDSDGAVAAPGDINGDGFDDVYLGVASSNEVRVLYGSASAPLTRVETLHGTAGSEFGLAVLE